MSPWKFIPELLWLTVLLCKFLLPMTGLNLVVKPLYCCYLSLLWTVDWDTVIPVLWRLFVMSLTDVLGFFLHSSHNVSDINCCYFPWLICSMSVAQYASGFFLFQDIPRYCPNYPQCLSNGSDPSLRAKQAILKLRKDSSLVFMLVFLSTQMQSSQAKSKAKTK